MPVSYKKIANNPEIGIARPDNVSDKSWNRAVELYKAAKAQGDAYPELTVAQAALETGWFKSPSGRYNYFGQKASKNQQGSYKTTQEDTGANFETTKAKFRDYDSLNAALEDRLDKWGSKYADADSVEDAIYEIWKYDPVKGTGTGYATDDKYDKKIKSILGMMGVPLNSTANTPAAKENPKSEYPTSEQQYAEVKKDNTQVQQIDYSRLAQEITQEPC